jgi:hypothetical protein
MSRSSAAAVAILGVAGVLLWQWCTPRLRPKVEAEAEEHVEAVEAEMEAGAGAEAEAATARRLPFEGSDGVTLVVINCEGGSQDGGCQNSINNDGAKRSDLFKRAIQAFHAEVDIGPQTAAVFLVSEPKSNLKGTLELLIPGERGSASCELSDNQDKGKYHAAVVWGSKQLGRASPKVDCSSPRPPSMYAGLDPAQCSTRHNELLSRLAVAELQLPLPPEGSPAAPGGAPGACRKSLFLCYHGPYKNSDSHKVGCARDLFKLAWALATRAGAPIAVGGDFNLNAVGVCKAFFTQQVPSGAFFEVVKYDPSPRRAHKEKIDWLFLLSPRGCTRHLRPCYPRTTLRVRIVVKENGVHHPQRPSACARVLDPAEPHRRGPPKAVVHAEFFDHDAIIVDLALAVRPDVVQAVSIIQAAARDRAARQGAKAPTAAGPPLASDRDALFRAGSR